MTPTYDDGPVTIYTGDCRAGGRFVKGHHWRPRQPWWGRDWLQTEYVTKGRSAAEIAREGGCTENNILFWLGKHGIPCRSMSEVRRLKRWGSYGESNPMYGRRGALNPNWKGGLTPARQALYSTPEWKRFERAVVRRDPACRLCGATKALELHHVIPFSEAPLLIMDPGNVIRVCRSFHQSIRGQEWLWAPTLLALLRGEEVVTVWRVPCTKIPA